MVKRKILSIDGGGIKGVFAAQFLADIEDEYKIQMCNYFDIITGTSTGAIIACGLSLGIPARKILELYLEKGEYIFSGNKLLGTLRSITNSKYKNTNLKTCLKEVFEDKLLGESKTRLLIPSFNLETGNVEIFKTSHHDNYIRDYKMKFIDVLLSTTAAPTYFPAYDFKNRGRYIDGGVGANNPSQIAVIEAITSCGWERDDLCLLSIGCTDDYKKFSRSKKISAIRVLDIIKFFMRAESKYSENVTRLLLKKDNYVRINPIIANGECSLDDTSKESMEALVIYAKDESKNMMKEIKNKFLDAEKEEFTPNHALQMD